MIAGILGASGLVGSHILSQLLSQSRCTKIYIFVRKPLAVKHEKVHEFVCDFDKLDSINIPEEIEVIFSALGTTRKKTPNLSEYRHIEVGILQHFIQVLKSKRLKQVHVVSSVGAGGTSKNFYLKIKTEMEHMVENQNVAMSCIYRPAMIRGNRNETRWAERMFIPIARLLDVLLIGTAKKYKSIHAEDIAAQMIQTSLHFKKGHHLIYFHQ